MDVRARFEVLTAMKIQVAVFWVATPCGVVVGYPNFLLVWAGLCPLPLLYSHLVRRVAANVLNKRSQTADKEWSSVLGVVRRG